MSKLIHQILHALHIEQEDIRKPEKCTDKSRQENKAPLNLSHNSMSVWQMDKEA